MVSEVCQCLERKTRKGKIGERQEERLEKEKREREEEDRKRAEEGRKAAEQKMKLINGK